MKLDRVPGTQDPGRQCDDGHRNDADGIDDYPKTLAAPQPPTTPSHNRGPGTDHLSADHGNDRIVDHQDVVKHCAKPRSSSPPR